MKKLMLIALLVLGVTAFAADEDTTVAVETRDVPNIAAVNEVTTMSLGESFMAAFGMGDTTVAGGATTEGGATASSVGIASAAANAATTAANNSTTIVTPYGKY